MGQPPGPKEELRETHGPCKVNGAPTLVLVDTGCSQTLIRDGVVPNPKPTEKEIQLQCIHGDTRLYPIARVKLEIAPHNAVLQVGVIPRLAYSLILGHDWPWFKEFLRSYGHQNPGGEEAATPQEGLLGQSVDSVLGEGPYDSPRAPDGPPPQTETSMGIICTRWSKTLRCRKTSDSCWHQRDLLHLAHAVPCVGHFEEEKTLQRVSQRFFWPGIHQEVRDFCAYSWSVSMPDQRGYPRRLSSHYPR